MSSRDHKRRERSWERDSRDRDDGRYSRGGRGRGGGGGGRGGGRDDTRRPRHSHSRSPPRRGDRESDRRGAYDRRDRDYPRDRDGDRRRDERDYRHDDRRDRDKDGRRRDDDRERDERRRDEDRGGPSRREELSKTATTNERPDTPLQRLDTPEPKDKSVTDGDQDEGEAMETVDPDEEAMMAMMGMSSFGTTKGKHIDGNQDGGVNIKKIRTWRQYMNRRGGFNRPLDKIK